MLDSAPTSTTWAPWATWTRALRIADADETATLSRYVEPRERLTVPIRVGASSPMTSAADPDGHHGRGEIAAIGVPQGGQVVERDHRGQSRTRGGCTGGPCRPAGWRGDHLRTAVETSTTTRCARRTPRLGCRGCGSTSWPPSTAPREGGDGTSGSINNAADKRVFHALRDLADVIVVGAGTVRAEGYRPNPKPLVWSRGPESCRRPCWRATPAGSTSRPARELPGLEQARSVLGDRVLVLGEDGARPGRAAAGLEDAGFSSLLCEGGPHLAADLLAAGLVDELCSTVVPTLVGALTPGSPRAPSVLARTPRAPLPPRVRQHPPRPVVRVEGIVPGQMVVKSIISRSHLTGDYRSSPPTPVDDERRCPGIRPASNDGSRDPGEWPVGPAARPLASAVPRRPDQASPGRRGQARGAGLAPQQLRLVRPGCDTPISPEQRIVEAAARLPAYGRVTGWAALRWMGGVWFDGLSEGGRVVRPVDLATADSSFVSSRA